MIATDFGLDFYRIYDALTRDYPRMAGLPKSGFAAGPCLFKDTMQLAAATDNNFSLGHAAMLVNEGLPNYRRPAHQVAVPAAAVDGRHARHGVQGRQRRPARVALVQAPQVLEYEAAAVLCTDPYIKDPRSSHSTRCSSGPTC